MNSQPEKIFKEYGAAADFKASIGSKGIDEQTKINERFYSGDQWYGVSSGNSRPLVRHNIIKRIGEYKMSQIISNPFSVSYSAAGNRTDAEIKAIKSLDACFAAASKRLRFNNLCAKALKNAYISGSGIIYTYFDPDIKTGVFMNDTEITGDICSEVLRIEDVFFADGYSGDIQSQPYIIISSFLDIDEVKAMAKAYGIGETQLLKIKADSSGKVQLFTKFYKAKAPNGQSHVFCVKSTDKVIIRRDFDTNLRLYPIAAFAWDAKSNLTYGDTELTYLIPNQIAINRLITAGVWSGVTMGMPIMVVNGDTVSEDITNEPGQIIKIYGTNEDVKGAVSYVTPPECVRDFGAAAQSLIDNTLIQSGANEVALGDSRPDNAAALENMYLAATLPLKLKKSEFYAFIEQNCLIWAEFFITHYGERMVEISDDSGHRYMDFNGDEYTEFYITAQIEAVEDYVASAAEKLELLWKLYGEGIIDAAELLRRLPKGMLKDAQELINKATGGNNDEGV